MIDRLITRLFGFVRDSRGSVSVEFVLVAPFLFWAFMASYVYFDGYRQSTVNLKAAYTISDLISRETEAIDEAYIDSMFALMQMLTRARSEVKMRVSVVRFDEAEGRYYVDWSAMRGYTNKRDNWNIQEIREQLPVMPDNERIILVETRNQFVPLFKVGLPYLQIKNLVFTRPRFAPQVAWSDGGSV